MIFAPGSFSSTSPASSAVAKSPGTNSPLSSTKKQRSASAEALEQRADHRAGHAVAAIHDHLQRAHRIGVDHRERGCLEFLIDVDFLQRAERGRAPIAIETLLDRAADVLDALIPRQRDRSLAHELRTCVGLRIVRGGAHQPPVELAGADEEIQHLGTDLAGIEHTHPLHQKPLAIARRELGSGQAHVATEAHTQLGRRLARQFRQHARKRASNLYGRLTVDLLAIEATDVIRLEDARVDRHGIAS